MKVIIDLIEDIRENILNALDYTVLAVLLKKGDSDTLEKAGEKEVLSVRVDDQKKALIFSLEGQELDTKTLLKTVEVLENEQMMYSVMLEVTASHPLMPVLGFGESHEEKCYVVFVEA